MNQLLFVLENTHYTILEHNDERLYVLAELLLDGQAIGFLLQAFPTMTNQELLHSHFAFERHGHIIIIKYYHAFEAVTEPHEPLTIDIRESELRKTIEQWKNILKQKPHEILLTREGDNFDLQPLTT